MKWVIFWICTEYDYFLIAKHCINNSPGCSPGMHCWYYCQSGWKEDNWSFAELGCLWWELMEERLDCNFIELIPFLDINFKLLFSPRERLSICYSVTFTLGLNGSRNLIFKPETYFAFSIPFPPPVHRREMKLVLVVSSPMSSCIMSSFNQVVYKQSACSQAFLQNVEELAII